MFHSPTGGCRPPASDKSSACNSNPTIVHLHTMCRFYYEQARVLLPHVTVSDDSFSPDWICHRPLRPSANSQINDRCSIEQTLINRHHHSPVLHLNQVAPDGLGLPFSSQRPKEVKVGINHITSSNKQRPAMTLGEISLYHFYCPCEKFEVGYSGCGLGKCWMTNCDLVARIRVSPRTPAR